MIKAQHIIYSITENSISCCHSKIISQKVYFSNKIILEKNKDCMIKQPILISVMWFDITKKKFIDNLSMKIPLHEELSHGDPAN